MKNILLAVTGLSPQVITETLYALHQNQRQVDAIHVITTGAGKAKIYAELLSGDAGYYNRYLQEYHFDSANIDFSHRNIHVIKDEYGNEIPDIASEADNEHLLKKCLELAFHFTKDFETAVFFSVAGGRKTMSACLTLAAQMYGRPQDRLYHVLVSPEFESNRDFFYPPLTPRKIELKDSKGQPYDKETRFAEVNLIHMPFVSIRGQLSSDMLKEPKDPSTLMLSLIKEEQSRLCVDLVRKKLIYKNMEFDMMPTRMALYAFFAQQKKDCSKRAEACKDCTDCFVDIQFVFENQPRITELYQRVCGSRPVEEMSDTGITGLNDRNFNSYKSKIKDELEKRFGLYALKELEIASVGVRPNTRYGIRMDRSKIEIVY
ncbi:MAG: CRISPR-associated ring nuclease Csm6 [Thermodesulfobacteriota bacterium]